MRRFLSILLASMLLIGCIAMPVSAEEVEVPEKIEETAPTEKPAEEPVKETPADPEPEEPADIPDGQDLPAEGSEIPEEPEQSEPSAEEPAAEEPAAEEPEQAPEDGEAEPVFTSGYVLIKKGAVAYSDPEGEEEAGTFTAASVAYAENAEEELEEDTLVKVTFDTESAAEEDLPLQTVYVEWQEIKPLSEEATEELIEELEEAGEARQYKENYLPAAFFAEKEEETGEDAPSERFPKVVGEPKVVVAPSVEYAATGDEVSFTATEISNIDGPYSFMWQRSSDGISWARTSLGGWDSYKLSFSVTEARLSYQYRLAVTGNGITYYSEGVQITFGSNAPTITVTTSAETASVGDQVTFTAEVTGGSGGYTFQWQRKAPSEGEDAWVRTSLGGWDSAELSFAATEARLSYVYRLSVSNGKTTWYSDAAQIILGSAEPTITVSTSVASATTGDQVSYIAVVSGMTGLTCQWQRKLPDAAETAWENTSLTGSDTATLSFTATEELLSYQYRLSVTNGSDTWYSTALKIDFFVPCPFTYTANTAGTGIIITGYTGTDTQIVIPATFDNLPVTEIGDEAFMNNTTMTKITVPQTVERIGKRAFKGCTSLSQMD